MASADIPPSLENQHWIWVFWNSFQGFVLNSFTEHGSNQHLPSFYTHRLFLVNVGTIKGALALSWIGYGRVFIFNKKKNTHTHHKKLALCFKKNCFYVWIRLILSQLCSEQEIQMTLQILLSTWILWHYLLSLVLFFLFMNNTKTK